MIHNGEKCEPYKRSVINERLITFKFKSYISKILRGSWQEINLNFFTTVQKYTNCNLLFESLDPNLYLWDIKIMKIFFQIYRNNENIFSFLSFFSKYWVVPKSDFFSMEKSRFPLQTNESDFKYLIFENTSENDVTENNVTLQFCFLHLLWSSNIWKEFILTKTEHS